MKIQDMILVIENDKGNEKNMLMTLEDYETMYFFTPSLPVEEAVNELADLLKTKISKADTVWVERYNTANKSHYARFCSSSYYLRRFLSGDYNDSKEFLFDRERSSKECLQALEEYNIEINGRTKGSMFRYEQKEHSFRQGDVLHNFNGIDYRVMECYSDRNLLLISVTTGQLLVAVGVKYYLRYPHNGEHTKDSAEEGIEWEHGVYLYDVPSEIDFVELRAEYSE